MTPFPQARMPVPSTAIAQGFALEEPSPSVEARASAALVDLEQLSLADVTIARLHRGAEARASDRARRSRVVEAHARSIEALLRSMRDLAASAASTNLANADRRALDARLCAWRREIDVIAAQASLEGTAVWPRRAGDEDLASDVVFDTQSLGVAESHVRDVAGAIEALEATGLAIATVGAVRDDLILTFRALELEVDAARAMRANLTAARGRLRDAEQRDALADDVIRTMGTPAYKA